MEGLGERQAVRRVIENRSGVITVDPDGTVFGHGMYDGKFNTDLKHDSNGIVRPYALSLFHPAPRDVLMIGLSSGSWAQVIASNPAVASLTIIEINPGYSEPDRASAGGRLGAPQSQGHDRDRRRPALAAASIRSAASTRSSPIRPGISVPTSPICVSAEFLDLVRHHLKDDGIFFYNTTDSARIQRTGCLAFPYGARFTNHMVVSPSPIAWDFGRWRRTLESYRIDGRAVFDAARTEDRAVLDRLMATEGSLTAAGSFESRPIEPCPDILARTTGKQAVTDDNMGSEWRYFLGLE